LLELISGILLQEVVLNYSWNVYKVFKNGKRAKAPITEFECSENDLSEYFENEVKIKFASVFKNSKYRIIRTDLSQEREVEKVDREEELYLKRRAEVLTNLVKLKGLDLDIRRVGTALVFSAKSNWNWQWAAIQKGTSNYIVGLSPAFDTHREADEWIRNQISMKP
jgi:hypothetical protein